MVAEKCQRRVLLAEDDYEMRALLSLALREAGYDVCECGNGADLLTTLSLLEASTAGVFDLVISDIRMPGASGLDVLEDLRHRKGVPPVILITAFGDDETHARARQLGAAAVFDKPFETDDLLSKVREVLRYALPDDRSGAC